MKSESLLRGNLDKCIFWLPTLPLLPYNPTFLPSLRPFLHLHAIRSSEFKAPHL